MKFRKDINGLRALAVIAVVLFHFNASWMPGGFSGVDVFFVISGFLMTGIIFRGMEQDNFSVLNFYVARANRIIPALALLCLVLLVFGWFYLTPLEYKALGKHAASSVGFLSNFVYWREARYFDAASHEKWLLHTWSLSVEWQFYIIYPLVLLALRKFLSIKTLKSLLIVGTVLGFIFSAIATYQSPNAAYYLFPTRAWEMMLGGIAYLYPFTLQENRKKFVEWTGLILVIASYFLISAENLWPGYLALFPVLGSFLIIQAQRNDSIITGNIVFQKLGAWSYSIYLWHWPFVVAIYTFSLPDHYIYIGMVLSVLLGFLSYKYVEKINFKRSFPTFLSYLKCKPVYIAGIVGVLGSVLFLKSEALTSYRLSTEKITIIEQQKRNPREPVCGKVENGVSPACIYGDGPVKAIVVGDSHANAQMVSIGNRAALANGSVLSMGLSACNTIKGLYSVNKNGDNPDYNCGKLVANVIEISAQKYPGVPVIIINRTSQNLYGLNEDKDFHLSPPERFVDKVFSKRNNEYRKNLTGHMINTICEFTQNNPVYLVRPTPEMKEDIPLTMFRSSVLNSNDKSIKITLDEYKKRQKSAFKMQDKAVQRCGAKVLDPLPSLCDSKYCYGDIDGVPLYFDDDHLSSYGSEVISPIYDEVFK
ncbi:possible acyltransferase family protein [Psychrobacter arcticus 273-4]|uniref:Possible acyltransferase family protein n=1 Tax=Psychrobacter arcticus (strain DSM 17307 / VKM B-2377 / 273-4) TaxID=259536 RepID=Q4FU11_PSYA2|nr:acyltransferase family protein [Psychrobacter arcticus]AAZ18497.1 possible acyltransferase family protein [Psychrobacter arcticus 273-4]